MNKINIKLEKVSKSFETKQNEKKKIVLKSLDLEIFSGKIHVILGGSGSGKSVLLKIILGLIGFESGQIFVNNEILTQENIFQKLLSKSGVLFQNNALFDSKNVYENLIFPFLGLSSNDYKKQDKSKEFAFEALKKVGLFEKEILRLDVNEISGGMQKRVAIARALIKSPEIMFLDEPTSGLDIQNSELIFGLVKELNQKYSMTFLIITHDVFFSPKIADYIYFLENQKANLVSKEYIQERFCPEIENLN
jgi:phospholipid/cholesterol/gamma-HCH transport system ATP-binding protein